LTLLVSIVAPTSGHAPLHGQFTPLPNKKVIVQQVRIKMMVLPSPSSTQNTHYNIYTAHMKNSKKKTRQINPGGDNGHQSNGCDPVCLQLHLM
ncbi:Uncharacterized protein APZ42_002081, partial [Daphnia magna]